MALNLGSVTNDLVEYGSFEDAYIDWLEADHEFTNFMNAIEISEKAKASQSMECIGFAEELLGCSLEVLTKGDSGKIVHNLQDNVHSAFNILVKLISELESLSKRIKNRKESNDIIKIPRYVKKLENANTVDKLLDIAHSFGTMECSVSTAIDMLKEGIMLGPRSAMRRYDKESSAYTGIWSKDDKVSKAKVTGTFRYAVKNNIGIKSGSFMNDYMQIRSVIAKIIKDTRNIIRNIKSILSQRHVHVF